MEMSTNVRGSPRRRFLLALAAAALCTTAAWATETVTYSYDARGRLTKVVRTGTVNNNITTAYGHDKADNRTAKTITGAP
jgi:YD repeat-containing protein